MRIAFTVDVGIDVNDYVEAGMRLDYLVKHLKVIAGDHGDYDIRSFTTHHAPVRNADNMVGVHESPHDDSEMRMMGINEFPESPDEPTMPK